MNPTGSGLSNCPVGGDCELPLSLKPVATRWQWGDRATIYTDGCCKGNPGPCGIGASFRDEHGTERHTVAAYAGLGTCNSAEWKALCRALWDAVLLGLRHVQIFSDSEVVVCQFNGEWRCEDALLARLRLIARYLANCLESVQLSHVPRELNSQADYLANIGVKKNA